MEMNAACAPTETKLGAKKGPTRRRGRNERSNDEVWTWFLSNVASKFEKAGYQVGCGLA